MARFRSSTELFFVCVFIVGFLSEHQVLCTTGAERNNTKLKEYNFANFLVDLEHYLDVSQVGTKLVHQLTDCAFACLRIVSCFSFNVAANAKEGGPVLCELLASDKFYSADKLRSTPSYHHFSIYSACSERPCMNGGTCIALQYDNFECKCPPGFKGKSCEIASKGCSDLHKAGITTSGVYSVNPDGQGTFSVYCDMITDRGGWTVFQRRQDGSQDFYLEWSQYKAGFGQLTSEFWLGNDKIHRLTASRPSELRVEVRDWSRGRVYAKYGSFGVGDEQSLYRLSVGSYSGTAGDSLAYHNNMTFTTKDSDNDKAGSENCAVGHVGGWWFKNCDESNLNGKYLGNIVDEKGVEWHHYKNNSLSMKSAEMKLRPTN